MFPISEGEIIAQTMYGLYEFFLLDVQFFLKIPRNIKSNVIMSTILNQVAMKRLFLLVVGLLACLGYGQSAFFNSVKPEATIVVTGHDMGASTVEITFQGTTFPQAAIDDKLLRLSKELGEEPRGVQSAVVGGQFVKVTFAVNGIIINKAPRFNLVALARAMAFGERPVRSFSVAFVGAAPNKGTPRHWFAPKDAWLMEGVATHNPKQIEYRIKVNTSNPAEITLPESGEPQVEPEKTPAGGQSKLFILVGIIIGAIAIGLLVYCALLRPRPRAR